MLGRRAGFKGLVAVVDQTITFDISAKGLVFERIGILFNQFAEMLVFQNGGIN